MVCEFGGGGDIIQSITQGVKQIFVYPVYSTSFTKSKVKTSQMSMDGWMDKQNEVYTFSEVWTIQAEKKWNSDTYYNMDESGKHYANRNKSDTKRTNKYYVIPLIRGT